MEIDFNPSRIPQPESGQSIVRKGAKPAAADATGAESSTADTTLKSRLNDISLVRPEKVDLGKSLVSVTTYPPAELLDRIAILLAVHLKH